MQGMHISDQGPPSRQAAPSQKQPVPQQQHQQGPRRPPPGKTLLALEKMGTFNSSTFWIYLMEISVC